MMMQNFGTSYLFGGNAPFVEELYENYLDNPASVPDEWREYFDKLAQQPGAAARDVPHFPVIAAFAEQGKRGPVRTVVAAGDDKKQVAVLQLINAYRFLGNRWANLDPLKRQERPEIQELEPSFYGFTPADLNEPFNTGSFQFGADRAPLGQIIEALKETYCGSIGVEYMYMSDIAQKRWLQERLEPSRGNGNYTPERKKRLLDRLTVAETLERYLHTRYVGRSASPWKAASPSSSPWTK